MVQIFPSLQIISWMVMCIYNYQCLLSTHLHIPLYFMAHFSPTYTCMKEKYQLNDNASNNSGFRVVCSLGTPALVTVYLPMISSSTYSKHTEKRVPGRQRWLCSEKNTPLRGSNPEHDHLSNTLQELSLFEKRLFVFCQQT